jgi:hypothetical protein
MARTVFHIVDDLVNISSDIDQHYQDNVLHYDMSEIPTPFLEIQNAVQVLKRALAELNNEGEGQFNYGNRKHKREVARNYAASRY